MIHKLNFINYIIPVVFNIDNIKGDIISKTIPITDKSKNTLLLIEDFSFFTAVSRFSFPVLT